MARTPIFKDIQRALRIAARLEDTKTSTAEGLEQLEEAAWSRRRFLRTAATITAGATLAPGFTQCCGKTQTPKVVIVGAGAAGLVCAYRLQQSGIKARVIEASTRVGGRMFSLRNFFPDNQLTELGGEYIDSNHKCLRSLAKELKLTLNDLYYDNGPNGHTYFFEGKPIRLDADFIELFRPVAKAIQTDIKQMKNGDYNTPYGQEIDRLSIAEWFEKRGITGVITSVLDAAYKGENGLELGEQSALNLLLTLKDEGPGADLRLFGESDERFHIVEGNDSVPTRVAQLLNREVELSTWLEAITSTGSGYSLALRGGKEVAADVVVLAIPFTTLRNVKMKVDLPASKQKAIQELGYGTNAKLIAGLSRRVWEETSVDDKRFDVRLTGYTFTDLPFQCCWETSRGQPGTHAILTNFAGGNLGKNLDQGSLQERASTFISEVDRIYKGTQDAFTRQAVRQHWPSSPFVHGSYTCYKPGQYSALADHIAEPVGNIFFAGEHTSDFSGFMEGGVESGERVADEILKKLGRRRVHARAA